MIEIIESLSDQLAQHQFTLYPVYAPAGGGKEFVCGLLNRWGRSDSEHLGCSAVLKDRARIRDHLGEQLAAAVPLIDNGTMVSDELVCAAIYERVLHRVRFGVKSFALDGFPRNIEQLRFLGQLDKMMHGNLIGQHVFLNQPFGRCLVQALRLRPQQCRRDDATLPKFIERWNEQFLGLTLPLLVEIRNHSPKKLAIITSRDMHKVMDVAKAMGYHKKDLAALEEIISRLPEFGQGSPRDDFEAVMDFVHTLVPAPTDAEEVKRLLADDGLNGFRDTSAA